MKEEEKRKEAVRRFNCGEKPKAIWISLNRSERWFFKWLGRFRQGDTDWYKSRPCRPESFPLRTPREIEKIVVNIRLELYNEGVFCGAQAITWEMEEQRIEPIPSLSTINRIIKRNGLTHRRTGRYISKGKKYPAPQATIPGAVHQLDRVGPCFLKGPIRFYSLNSIDIATGRCGIQPVITKGGQELINAIWAIWSRLGLPKCQQVDNDMPLYGSPTHPRGMGQFIRLCLHNGIEPYFIPIREPWWNGVVEKFNDHWEQKFYHRVPMYSMKDLIQGSLAFEYKHNTRMKYSKLGGKTPLDTLTASGHKLRFLPKPKAPQIPLPRPEQGKYHVIRYIRSNGILNIFSEQFRVPPEAIQEYVSATIDVTNQQLQIRLHGKLIDQITYQMR